MERRGLIGGPKDLRAKSKYLCNSKMSAPGPNTKCRHAPAMSAHRGIADVMCSLRDLPVVTSGNRRWRRGFAMHSLRPQGESQYGKLWEYRTAIPEISPAWRLK